MKTDKQKFTATLVHEADKALVVAIREKSKLSEKDIMSKLIAYGLQHEDEILAQAEEEIAAKTAEREQSRKENYELLKSKMKEAREQAKAERAAKSNKTEQVEA